MSPSANDAALRAGRWPIPIIGDSLPIAFLRMCAPGVAANLCQ
jgi:hypothetical protein